MRSSSYFLYIVPLFIISCAQKLDQDHEYYTSAYTSAGDGKSPYSSCNVFSDETFKGSVWSDPHSSRDQNGCIYIDISESPKELLTNEDLFLQMYPFSIQGGEMIYSSSALIRTLEKVEGDEGTDVLIQSQIIDAHLVETELQLQPSDFLQITFLKFVI